MLIRLFTIWILCALCFSCEDTDLASSNDLFQEIDKSQSQVDFINEVHNSEDFNIFNYRNFYNGGGVAIGDINNDGLADVFLTSNMGENKLYLNEGDFKFKDLSLIHI